MRIAIYARFSSDLQNPKSADDQINEARSYAEKRGDEVVRVFKDEGISGASIKTRPALREMLRRAEEGLFDAVLVEQIDRLSRDIADTAYIRKHLEFHNVKIVAVHGGEMDMINTTIRGLQGELFLRDLRDKTKRGQHAALSNGRIAGGKCYGYDLVAGRPGERVINPEQAKIVQRIFSEYIAGDVPNAIAMRLNKERIPGPTGGPWTSQAILSSRTKRTGILYNRLYSGVFEFDKQQWLKNPATGKRVPRLRDTKDVREQEFPALRIIDDETWCAAQARLTERSNRPRGQTTRRKYLLSGLLKCHCCGGNYVKVQGAYWRCNVNKAKGESACTNKLIVNVDRIERRLIAGVRDHLLSPDALRTSIQETRKEISRLQEAENRERAELEKERREIAGKVRHLVDYIESGDAPKGLGVRIHELEARSAQIDQRLAELPASSKLELSPVAELIYRQIVENLHAVLQSPADAAAHEAGDALRDIIRAVTVVPNAAGEPDLDVMGDLAALLADDPMNGYRFVVVAGAGFEPTTFRL